MKKFIKIFPMKRWKNILKNLKDMMESYTRKKFCLKNDF